MCPLSPITGSSTKTCQPMPTAVLRALHLHTPEECPRLRRCFQLQVSRYRPNSLYSFRARRITRQQNVKVRQVILLEPAVDFCNLLRRGLGTLPLLVGGMIACPVSSMVSNSRCALVGGKGGSRGRVVLYCTVFNAATSHPKACMTNAAIVFPTWLCRVRPVELEC